MHVLFCCLFLAHLFHSAEELVWDAGMLSSRTVSFYLSVQMRLHILFLSIRTAEAATSLVPNKSRAECRMHAPRMAHPMFLHPPSSSPERWLPAFPKRKRITWQAQPPILHREPSRRIVRPTNKRILYARTREEIYMQSQQTYSRGSTVSLFPPTNYQIYRTFPRLTHFHPLIFLPPHSHPPMPRIGSTTMTRTRRRIGRRTTRRFRTTTLLSNRTIPTELEIPTTTSPGPEPTSTVPTEVPCR